MHFMGRGCAQEPQDFLIWDQLFLENPQIKQVIELGTGYGGFSLYLALKCRDIGADFHTFDNIKSSDFAMDIEREINLEACFHNVDIFSEEWTGYIRNLITQSEKPCLIFFDDGDKPREWLTFASYTAPGDFLVVHDWDTEFNAGDIGDVKVERILTDESDARGPGWKAMWFKRL